MDRRAFLAAAAAAGLAPSGLRAAARRRARRLSAVGIQLYSVRGEMQKDFEGTLARLAAMGYREVEFAGLFGRAPVDVRALLDRLRLQAPSAHVGFETIEAGWPDVLDAAKTLGQEFVTVAWIPEERRKTLDDWKRVGDLYNRAGDQARTAGLRFAFHNHSYEFVPLEGKLPYDVLIEATDPKLVWLEMDIFWITYGGQDPLAYFARCPGRFPMVHVKDMAAGGAGNPNPDAVMRDVGKGSIDWKAIFARSGEAGIRHYFVEYDNPPHPFEDVGASLDYLKSLDF